MLTKVFCSSIYFQNQGVTYISANVLYIVIWANKIAQV